MPTEQRKRQSSWYSRAFDEFDAGRFIEALVCIERYREQRPDGHPGIHLHVEILTRLRRFSEAAVLVSSMLEWPKSQDIARTLAKYCDVTRAFPSAEAWYRTGAELEPDSTVGWIFLGAFLARHGRFEEAKTVQLHAATLAGDPDEALFNCALVLRAQGRFLEAAKMVRAARRIDPCYGSYSQTLADIDRAMKVATVRHPDDAFDSKWRTRRRPVRRRRYRSGLRGIWWDRALETWGNRKMGESLACIERYRDLAPENRAGFVLHAEILTDLRRFDESLALLVLAGDAGRTGASAYARHFSERGDFANAEIWLRRQNEIAPASATLELAELREKDGRLEDALHLFEEAANHASDREDALLSIAVTLRALGRFEEAILAFARVEGDSRTAAECGARRCQRCIDLRGANAPGDVDGWPRDAATGS